MERKWPTWENLLQVLRRVYGECNINHIGVRFECGHKNINWLCFCWSLTSGTSSCLSLSLCCYILLPDVCVSLGSWLNRIINYVRRWGRKENRWAKPVWHRPFDTLGDSKNTIEVYKNYVLWTLISANILSHLLYIIKLLVNVDTKLKLLIII